MIRQQKKKVRWARELLHIKKSQQRIVKLVMHDTFAAPNNLVGVWPLSPTVSAMMCLDSVLLSNSSILGSSPFGRDVDP
jgi:hypothetical protein